MIHQVYSSTLTTFKALSFRPGLNLVVAEKSKGATLRQTRNGAGKSSFVEIIHFLLGGNCDKTCIFRSTALLPHTFGMKFDAADVTVTIERNGAPKSPVRIVAGSTEVWPKDAKVDAETGIVVIGNTAWRQALGEKIFKLPHGAPTFSPTFRSMLGFFARRRDDGGFQEPESFSTDADAGDLRTGLSYMFGLDWEIPRKIRESREKERSLKALRKELKRGVYGRVMEPAAELKSRVAVTERRLSKLDADIQSFRVLPEYHDLESEASSIAVSLSEMANQNTIDQETIEVLERTLEIETPPEIPDLYRVYQEAGVVVSKEALERVEAAKKFHMSVIANRRQHLEGDLEQLRTRLSRRRDEMARIDARRQEIMGVLQAHGALDQFSKIESEATRMRTELGESRHRLEVAERVETAKTDLAIERAQLHKLLLLDHKERDMEIKQAIVQFEELSESLSEKEGTLTITADESGPVFRVEVPSFRSGGVKSMQIFCFDLTLQLIAKSRGLSPGFLIHDSHLFDGMDPRQRGKALKLGAELAQKHGFQYIVTINSDALDDADVRSQFDPTAYMLPIRLTDATDDGGLFGFRFD